MEKIVETSKACCADGYCCKSSCHGRGRSILRILIGVAVLLGMFSRGMKIGMHGGWERGGDRGGKGSCMMGKMWGGKDRGHGMKCAAGGCGMMNEKMMPPTPDSLPTAPTPTTSTGTTDTTGVIAG